MGRKFKCRNGAIMEEADNNYNYHCLYDPDGYWNKGDYAVMVGKGNNEVLVDAGAHGRKYDIVEELKPRKQKKETVSGIKRYYYDRIPEYNSVIQADESKLLKFDKDDPNMVKLPNGWQYYCPPENRSMLMKALVDSMTDTDEIVLDVTRGQEYTMDYDHDDYPMFRDIQGKPTLKRIIIKKV